MKNHLLVIILITLGLASFGVSAETELINDPTFSQGISAIPSCLYPDSDPVCANGEQYLLVNPFGVSNKKAVWSLGQWGSSASIPGQGSYSIGNSNSFNYENAYKKISYSSTGEITFSVSGEDEYAGKYNSRGLALILGQTISAPGENSHSSGNISDLAEITFSADMQLVAENQNIKSGYEKGKHAAIFPVNLTIQNLNINSPGYGQYVWLQIPTYDDRNDFPELYINLDIASKMLIYAIPYKKFATTSLHSGSLVSLKANVLPEAIEAVKIAYDKGLLKSNDLSDYKIGGFNIGY
jgi:hypothetical protein